MTVNELHELLEKLALDDVTVDKSNYNRLFALSVLGMVEAVGIGVRGITDAGRELLSALWDRERMELALRIVIGYQTDEMMAQSPESFAKTDAGRDALIQIGVAFALSEADKQLAAKPGAVPGGQE